MQDSIISGAITLPARFPTHSLQSFYARDEAGLSERVNTDKSDTLTIEKALMSGGEKQLLSLSLPTAARDNAELTYTLKTTGDVSAINASAIKRQVAHMVGLTQSIEEFEQQYARHNVIGPMVQNNLGLRVPQTATPYEAMVWAIIGQQISVTAAIAIRHRLIETMGLAIEPDAGDAMACFPDEQSVLAANPDDLLAAGLSQTKLNALIRLSEMVDSNALPIEDWLLSIQQALSHKDTTPVVDDIRAQLLDIKGIGPWTVNYVLLRGFAWLDGSLHGDVAVRRNLKALLNQDEDVDAKQAETWLADFSPWRALVGAHLWARQSAGGY